jgi:hypothetical protein
MHAIWSILVEFLFRLTCGIALAMGITPAKWVSSGFFRVHLWVLMGVQTFAALVLYSHRAAYDVDWAGRGWMLVALATLSAILSYVGAVIWMYEANRAGKIAIGMVTLLAASGCQMIAWRPEPDLSSSAIELWFGHYLFAFDWLPGMLVLGSVVTAMLLGHWYLNSPGMRMEPLQRLLILIAVALVIRAVWSGVALGLELNERFTSDEPLRSSFWSFLALRWLAGIIGPAVMTWLTWLTLKIPNTQSATGILYAAVILVFIGELTARLMGATSHFPL